MKTLIVFYSRTGTTRKIAEEISKRLKADIEEIIDKKSREGMIGFLSGGKDAVMKKTTQIERPLKDPTTYDLVILGSPVWAGKMSPALRSYIQNRKFKKVAFFLTKGSITQPSEMFKELETIIQKPISTLDLTTREVHKKEYQEKLDKFIKELR